MYVLWLVPEFFVRLVLWTLTHTVYRIRIDGLQHVPVRGPALLVCNHLSHVDGLIVGATMQRFVRFMVYRPIYELPLLNALLRFMHAIPVSATRQDVVASLGRARQRARGRPRGVHLRRGLDQPHRATSCRSSAGSSASSRGSTCRSSP